MISIRTHLPGPMVTAAMAGNSEPVHKVTPNSSIYVTPNSSTAVHMMFVVSTAPAGV